MTVLQVPFTRWVGDDVLMCRPPRRRTREGDHRSLAEAGWNWHLPAAGVANARDVLGPCPGSGAPPGGEGRTCRAWTIRTSPDHDGRPTIVQRAAKAPVDPIRSILAGTVVLCLAVLGWAPLEARASEAITHGSRARPWVALTFDDGWSSERCARIARTLRSKNATATFLINGAIVRRAPKRWRTILRGFPVANHTMDHAWLTRISGQDVRRQIVANEQAIERILGRQMLHLLRPPYRAYDRDVLRIADSLRYRTVLWDTDSGDTRAGATTSSVIRDATTGGKGAIVLLHCGPSMTPAAVGPIVDSYRRRGFKLVDLGQMLLRVVSPTACRVRNRDSGRARDSLQAAIRAARSGDRLTVRGTCRGATTIGKRVRIRGISNEDSGPPTLTGRKGRRVMSILAGVDVTIRDLAISRGKAERGGGIVNRGKLTLVDVDVRENRATASGGGILNLGRLTLGGETSVRANASVLGAGITNLGTLTLRGATAIRRNVASDDGGGVFNRGHLVMAGDSSIARNESGGLGAGVRDMGTQAGVICAPDAGANVHDNTPDDCATG